MGRTAARVSTSQRETGSRARPVGGLVVRRTSCQADNRLCTAGAVGEGGWMSLTWVIVSTETPPGTGVDAREAREGLW